MKRETVEEEEKEERNNKRKKRRKSGVTRRKTIGHKKKDGKGKKTQAWDTEDYPPSTYLPLARAPVAAG